jgi:hypothetical protein
MLTRSSGNLGLEKILGLAQQLAAAEKWSEAATEYERVLQITQDGEKLTTDQLCQVYQGMLVSYMALKQPERMRRVSERGLDLLPENQDFLVFCLIAAEADGQQDIVEIAAHRLLDLDPQNRVMRVKWKKSRRAQGKSFFSSLPEEQKKTVYRHYEEVFDQEFFKILSRYPIELMNAQDLAEVNRIDSLAKKGARDAAVSLVQREFSVSPFNLSLIEAEGEMNRWETGSATVKPDPVSRRRMRDRLQCPYCNQFSDPPYWPANGDMTPFFVASAEEINDDIRDPERYRERVMKLPVICLECNKTWFIFWEDEPDNPIGTHFIRHINSACQQFPEIIGPYSSFIDNQVLGQVVEQIRNYSAGSIRKQKSIWNKSFFHSEILHWITVVPSADPEMIKGYFGQGYLANLDEAVNLAYAQGKELTFVNWILGLEENGIFTEIGYYPNKADRAQGYPVIFPIDLLMPEERRQIRL